MNEYDKPAVPGVTVDFNLEELPVFPKRGAFSLLLLYLQLVRYPGLVVTGVISASPESIVTTRDMVGLRIGDV